MRVLCLFALSIAFLWFSGPGGVGGRDGQDRTPAMVSPLFPFICLKIVVKCLMVTLARLAERPLLLDRIAGK